MKAIIFVGLACVVQVYTGRIMDMLADTLDLKSHAVETHDIRKEIERKYADLFQSPETMTEMLTVCKDICQTDGKEAVCEICRYLFGAGPFYTTAGKRSGEGRTGASDQEGAYSNMDAGWGVHGGPQVSFSEAGSSRRAQSSTGASGRKKTYLSLANANSRDKEAMDAGRGRQGGAQISFRGAGSSDEGTMQHFDQQHPQMANRDASGAQNRPRAQGSQKHRY